MQATSIHSAQGRWQLDIQFLEQGDIYFFYKPKKEVEKVTGMYDVSRFFFVLDPESESPSRYIVMGNKKMPDLYDGDKSTWGFVQIVGGRGFKAYRKPTPTRLKTASRPAGEGIYLIVSHRTHTHLLYTLELPQRPGNVQNAFQIEKEANYIFLERPTEKPPTSPDEPFSNFSPAKIDNLNKRGTEILLIGVGADIGRLGITAYKNQETINTADIFTKLQVDRDRHPSQGLISGEWE